MSSVVKGQTKATRVDVRGDVCVKVPSHLPLQPTPASQNPLFSSINRLALIPRMATRQNEYKGSSEFQQLSLNWSQVVLEIPSVFVSENQQMHHLSQLPTGAKVLTAKHSSFQITQHHRPNGPSKIFLPKITVDTFFSLVPRTY